MDDLITIGALLLRRSASLPAEQRFLLIPLTGRPAGSLQSSLAVRLDIGNSASAIISNYALNEDPLWKRLC